MEMIITVLLALGGGALAGFVFGTWRAGRTSEKQQLEYRTLETELVEARALIQAREEATETMSDTFSTLANNALTANRDEFVNQTLTPLQDKINALATVASEMEGKRENAYEALNNQDSELASAVTGLKTALSGSSQQRGKWGEIQLENLVKLCGMSEHCDFDTQRTIRGDDHEGRPDMIIKLPDGSGIPVDSKVSCQAYLSALETDDATQRGELLKQHAEAVRKHVKDLARKQYADTVEKSFNYTVMHMNAEQFLAAACTEKTDLLVEALEGRVLITTPITLVALLHTVRVYHQDKRMAETVDSVLTECKTLWGRIATFVDHLGGIHKGLKTAVGSYNDAVGSYESRVVPQGKKVEEIEAPGTATVSFPKLEIVDESLREPPDKAVGE